MASNDHTRGYGKLKQSTEEDEAMYTRDSNRGKLVVTIIISSIFFFSLLLILGVPPLTNNTAGARTYRSDSVAAICNITRYPYACSTAMSSSLMNRNTTRAPDPEQILTIFLRSSVTHLTNLSSLLKPVENNSDSTRAMNDCVDEFSDAIYLLETALSAVEACKGEKRRNNNKTMTDVQTWISSAMTYQETCSDGLNEVGLKEFVDDTVRLEMMRSTESLSNSLAITANMEKIMQLLS